MKFLTPEQHKILCDVSQKFIDDAVIKSMGDGYRQIEIDVIRQIIFICNRAILHFADQGFWREAINDEGMDRVIIKAFEIMIGCQKAMLEERVKFESANDQNLN